MRYLGLVEVLKSLMLSPVTALSAAVYVPIFTHAWLLIVCWLTRRHSRECLLLHGAGGSWQRLPVLLPALLSALAMLSATVQGVNRMGGVPQHLLPGILGCESHSIAYAADAVAQISSNPTNNKQHVGNAGTPSCQM